ncbi:hypothetical protein ACWV2X_08515 [Streptomyces hydrogenans]
MNRDQIMDTYQQQLDRIQSNRAYSDRAKQVLAAKAYTAASSALAKLRDDEVTAIDNRREFLYRRMFGRHDSADAQTVIARRDANDRAAKLDNPRVAEQQLRDALRQGDTTMAQAIAEHAAGMQWGDVLGAYGDTRPGFREVVEEYSDLTATRSSDQWGFMHTVQHVAPTPSNLGNMSEAQIASLAAEELGAA